MFLARTNDMLTVLRESDEAEPLVNLSFIPLNEVGVAELFSAQRRGASHGGSTGGASDVFDGVWFVNRNSPKMQGHLTEIVVSAAGPSKAGQGSGMVTLYDLGTGSTLFTLKQTLAGLHSTVATETRDGQGGLVLAAQSDKKLLNVYSYQRVGWPLTQPLILLNILTGPTTSPHCTPREIDLYGCRQSGHILRGGYTGWSGISMGGMVRPMVGLSRSQSLHRLRQAFCSTHGRRIIGV